MWGQGSKTIGWEMSGRRWWSNKTYPVSPIILNQDRIIASLLSQRFTQISFNLADNETCSNLRPSADDRKATAEDASWDSFHERWAISHSMLLSSLKCITDYAADFHILMQSFLLCRKRSMQILMVDQLLHKQQRNITWFFCREGEECKLFLLSFLIAVRERDPHWDLVASTHISVSFCLACIYKFLRDAIQGCTRGKGSFNARLILIWGREPQSRIESLARGGNHKVGEDVCSLVLLIYSWAVNLKQTAGIICTSYSSCQSCPPARGMTPWPLLCLGIAERGLWELVSSALVLVNLPLFWLDKVNSRTSCRQVVVEICCENNSRSIDNFVVFLQRRSPGHDCQPIFQ